MAQDPKADDPGADWTDEDMISPDEAADQEHELAQEEVLEEQARAERAATDAEERMATAADMMAEPGDVENDGHVDNQVPSPDSQAGGTGGSGGGNGGHHHAAHGNENAVDLALGALCQSYSHALSLAFHDAVGERQRRTALIDAAVARAVEEIASSKPKEFEDRIKDLKAGLDILNAPNGADMAAYAGITREFREAAESLMQLRDQLRS
jgi:hypothetical protein